MMPGMSGMPGMNSKKMQAMMKQMGINQEEIDASRVIIEKNSGEKTIIENPSVQKITMQGQESFQVSGDIREESAEEEISEEDIQTIVDKTNCSEEKARETLERTGDLTETIMELSESEEAADEEE